MMKIIDAALSRSRTVMTFLVISVLAGLYAYIEIPKEADPDIQVPFVMISMVYPGISPEDAERLLIKPMEVRLRTLEGLKELQAFAAPDYAGIFLEFDLDMDMDQVLIEVREEVSIGRADIPQDAEEPIVNELNFAEEPVIIAGIYGEVPERTLYQLARAAKDELEAIPTVLKADLIGAREELLEVVIDPAKLESYNVSQTELINAVRLNNRVVPAGTMDTGKGSFNVKVPGLFETASDVYSLAIKSSGDGVVVLSDLAEIKRTFKDRQGFARVNGKPAFGLAVSKRVGENVIENNQAVRDALATLSESWPESIQTEFIFDVSRLIDDDLSSLQASILTAISLVMIIVVAALGIRSAAMVGFAIPASFMIAFLFLYLLGFTVNMMVMFGLVLSVGILVDGAIVVVEYADRKMAEGLPKREAFGMAAKRMFWPIVSSTGTTLAAFVPMLFWPGISGKFMSYLPFTLIFVLSASLLVALIYLPVVGSIFGKTAAANKETLKAMSEGKHVDVRQLSGFSGRYARTVDRMIRRPGRYIGYACLIVLGVIVAFTFADVKTTYFIDVDPNEATVQIMARGNYSAEEKHVIVSQVEDLILDVDGIASTFTSTNSGGMQSMGRGAPADMIGNIFFELTHYKERRSGKVILAEVRERTSKLPGIKIQVNEMEHGPPVGKDVQIELQSAFGDLLIPAATEIRHHLEGNVEGLIEIEDTRPLPGIEYEILVDREKAGRFGADITTIGSYVQLITNGILIGKYRPDDAIDEVDIRVRFPSFERHFDQLGQLKIRTSKGHVPMSNFVSILAKPKIDQVNRIDGKRIIRITANSDLGFNSNQQINKISQWIKNDANLDPRISVKFAGASEEQAESASFLSVAMLAALFLMAIILLTQFNSFYHSTLILSSVILSTVGVLLGLIVTGQDFSVIMSGTGVVALAGIVVNNNIVLIDTFQRMMRDGYDIADAIVHTAVQRMRPILLTTITTIFGLLPMAMALRVDYIAREITLGDPNSMWWIQLSTAVCFGLGFSTLLTLFLTPCLLMVPSKLKGRSKEIIATVLTRGKDLVARSKRQGN